MSTESIAKNTLRKTILSVLYYDFDHGHPAVAHILMPFDQLTVGWSIDVRVPGPSNTARNSQSTD